jgi:hypothetical protein
MMQKSLALSYLVLSSYQPLVSNNKLPNFILISSLALVLIRNEQFPISINYLTIKRVDLINKFIESLDYK